MGWKKDIMPEFTDEERKEFNLARDRKAMLTQIRHVSILGKPLTLDNIAMYGPGTIQKVTEASRKQTRAYLNDLLDHGFVSQEPNGDYSMTSKGRTMISSQMLSAMAQDF